MVEAGKDRKIKKLKKKQTSDCIINANTKWFTMMAKWWPQIAATGGVGPQRVPTSM